MINEQLRKIYHGKKSVAAAPLHRYPTRKGKIYAMHDHEFYALQGQVEELQARLDALEANSRNTVSSDQPIAGPPSQSEDSRALARPVSLAELRAFMESHVAYRVPVDRRTDWAKSLIERDAEILQYLTKLDQGPVASRQSRQKRW